MLCDITHREALQRACRDYLDERSGTYEFRCLRFKSVADKLFAMGLKDEMTVIDAGAGVCEFDYYLRTERNWRGMYIPVDGVIDGTNLELWVPRFGPDFITAIEIIEHLRDPHRFLSVLERYARRGAVITTPNPKTTDVLGMDHTHVSECPEEMFRYRGWIPEITSHFGKPNDSILATYSLEGNRHSTT